MRIVAFAGALLLLAAVPVAAQVPITPQDLANAQAGNPTTGAVAPSSASRTSTSAATAAAAQATSAAAAAQAAVSSATAATNPLAGATAASPVISSAQQATQNSAVSGFITTTDGLTLPVFGTELFTGSFAGTRPGDRPDYIVQVGDSIVINLYGAVSTGVTQTVDASGNVFIIGVGPVHVQGVTAGALQDAISGRVRQVFTTAVGVYATVSSAGSIGVFVSGDVAKPGRFLGGASDSVLFYLSQAGGIDAARGSLRNIEVRRHNQVIATYDLYDFLVSGRIEPIKFQEGDMIFVEPRGTMVGVTGVVRNAFAFEAPGGGKRVTGADILPLTRPEPNVSGAIVRGYRNGVPRSAYFPLADFARVVLSDADHVEFRTEGYLETMTVAIAGQLKGPTAYVMPRGAMLSQLLAKLPLDGTDVDPRWVHVQRPEVAAEQKRALDQALINLQKQVLTAAPATTDAAQLATAQAQLIQQFVTQAESITPDGNVAVYTNGQFQDMRLQDGDTVILPNRTDVVIVAGEILNPGGLAHVANMDARGYILRAGGFAAHANEKQLVLRHRDGSGEVAGPHTRPLPGDEIVVLPKVGTPYLQFVKDITQILFQIALTTATVVKL